MARLFTKLVQAVAIVLVVGFFATVLAGLVGMVAGFFGATGVKDAVYAVAGPIVLGYLALTLLLFAAAAIGPRLPMFRVRHIPASLATMPLDGRLTICGRIDDPCITLSELPRGTATLTFARTRSGSKALIIEYGIDEYLAARGDTVVTESGMILLLTAQPNQSGAGTDAWARAAQVAFDAARSGDGVAPLLIGGETAGCVVAPERGAGEYEWFASWGETWLTISINLIPRAT